MLAYTLTHLTDGALLRNLTALVAQDRTTTAALLAHIAEVDARKLYLPAGYPSMHAYCVDELHLSEDAAYKRIQAARAARQFPALFTALAEGRLHLAAVCLLAPHLTPMNVDELVAAAAYQRKSGVELFLRGDSQGRNCWRWCKPSREHPPRNTVNLPRGKLGLTRRIVTGRRPHLPRDKLTPFRRSALELSPSNLPRGKLTHPPREQGWHRWHPSASRSNSRSARVPMTSSGTPRRCSVTPFLPGISHRCSIGPSMP